MSNFPNQREVIINREQVVKGTSGRQYVCCYSDNLFKAMRELSKTAFEVYVYLLCNKQGYSLEYSTAHISQMTGICVESARKAFLELCEKNYIENVEDTSYQYNFFEVKRNKEERKKIIDPYTREEICMTYRDLVKSVGIFDAISIWRQGKNV